MTNEQLNSLLFFETNKDTQAIAKYIIETEAITPQALQLQDGFISWWNSLSWFQQNLSNDTYDELRNRSHAFSVANQETEAEKREIRKIIGDGVTTEEMEGGIKRSTSTGDFPVSPKPLIPDKYKFAAIIGGAATLVLVVLKKIKLL